MDAEFVLNFWFKSIEPKFWWAKDLTFDKNLKQQFSQLHQQAGNGELVLWRQTAKGRLAEILILDQFSRNIYRNTAAAFAYDGMALLLAQEAINSDTHVKLEDRMKAFLYMPFMHSESLVIHQQALQLFSEPGLEGNIEFEKRHYAIIKRFGRYPHRNEILGRESTPEEKQFLTQPGTSF